MAAELTLLSIVSTQNGGTTDVVLGAQGTAGTGLAGVDGRWAFGARGNLGRGSDADTRANLLIVVPRSARSHMLRVIDTPRPSFTDLHASLLDYAGRVEEFRSPEDVRLEQLADPDPARVGSHNRLTPRELAVLRLVSTGAQAKDAAQALGLGAETIRSHLKKAQSKLGVGNRAQAVAEALRQHLIP